MNLTNFMPVLRIGNLEAKIPIIQGGMSVGISLSSLSSAVANEGGIGVIGSAGIGMFEEDFNKNYKEANKRALRKEIRRARERTDGIIGVNIMVALTDFDDLLKVAVDEEVDVVLSGAGLPLKIPVEYFENRRTKFIPIVSSAKAADLILRYWERSYGEIPDGFVVEGPMAGGHLGFKKDQIDDPRYSLENILQAVLMIVERYSRKHSREIPVIAAGGIYTGEDIHEFIKLGASGVQMATRFVATYECDASMEFKMAYINAKKDDLIIIDSPVGLPGRAIRSEFLNDVAKGKRKPFRCFWKCLKTCDFRKSPYCIADALTNAKGGNLKDGFAFAGANAYRISKMMPVKELIAELIRGYEKARRDDENIREKVEASQGEE